MALSVYSKYHILNVCMNYTNNYICTKLGTCSMKPHEQGGVVDSRLNVYGVKDLKVAGTV